MVIDSMDELLKRRARSMFGAIEFAKEAHRMISAIDEAYSDFLLTGSEEAQEIAKDALEIKRQIWRLKEKLEQL